MSYAVEPLFERATLLLEREERRLQALDQARSHIVLDSFDNDGVAAMSRALTYVVCGGILEQLMRELPQALALDLMSLGVPRSRLPIGLLSILEAAEFRKCGGKTSDTLLSRVRLAKSIADHANDSRIVADISDDLILADGTTIGAKHFSALWEILGLPGDWRNETNDLLLLKELQSKRNDVAHWEEDPVDVGRAKTYGDLRALTKALSRLIDHVYLHVCDWLDKLASTVPAPVP